MSTLSVCMFAYSAGRDVIVKQNYVKYLTLTPAQGKTRHNWGKPGKVFPGIATAKDKSGPYT